ASETFAQRIGRELVCHALRRQRVRSRHERASTPRCVKCLPRATAYRICQSKGNGPPNSLQQPTPCRSLARRFAAQFSAARFVALLEPEGTARLSKSTLARPATKQSPAEGF